MSPLILRDNIQYSSRLKSSRVSHTLVKDSVINGIANTRRYYV